MILKEAVSFFLNACELEKNLSPHTLAAYSSDLRQFCSCATGLGVHEVSHVIPQVLHSFVHTLKNVARLKDSSIRRKIAVLKSFFRFLEQRDAITLNPFRKTNFSFRQGSAIPRILNTREIGAIMNAVKESLTPNRLQELNLRSISKGLFVALRDNAIVELLFYTGARVGEIVRLDLADCDLEGGLIKLNGKGRRQRVVHVGCAPVTSALKLFIQARAKIARTDGALFLNTRGTRLSVYSVERRVAKYAAKASLEVKVTPHTFRHTMATMMLENGASIRTVQEILGHSSIKTTEIYTHVSSDQKRRAMSEFHPRNLLWV